MTCPHTHSHVKDARDFTIVGSAGIRRERECVKCKKRFLTYEFQSDAMAHFLATLLSPVHDALSLPRTSRYISQIISRVNRKCSTKRK